MTASIITSVVTGGVDSHATVSEEANAYATDFVIAGIVGSVSNTGGASPSSGGFAVNQDASPDMGITISSGIAYVSGTPSGQDAQVLRARMTANYTSYTINSNSSGSTKYDWIYLVLSAPNASAPSSAADNVITLMTSRSSSNTSDNGTPPTYGLLLSVITVSNGASSIVNANIVDSRTQSFLTTNVSTDNSGWHGLGYTPNTVVYNGQRSYTMTFNSVDLTATISAGNRLRTTRTVSAPTQCTSLNGSTQYYSKTSPAAMTFTNNFVVSAWIKLASYQTGYIVSRTPIGEANGWNFGVTSAGQIQMTGRNGAGNARFIVSNQSLPLNRWVHVAGQLDMSTWTATPSTCYMMIDGVDVPITLNQAGTNPTALVQSGDLVVGGITSGGVYFSGKVAQVAIFNAKVTEATMQTYISQGLAGTETSLISAYSFNNAVTDLNVSNANNLTANGSAVATSADSPFGMQASGLISSTLDYSIVESVSFSTNTTLVAQVPEGCTIPTGGGVTTTSYSGLKTPYAFPSDINRWTVLSLQKVPYTKSSPSAATWYNQSGGTQGDIVAPIGKWRLSFRGVFQGVKAASAVDIYAALGTTASNADNDLLIGGGETGSSPATSSIDVASNVTLAAATPYYLNLSTTYSSVTTLISLLTSYRGAVIIELLNNYV